MVFSNQISNIECEFRLLTYLGTSYSPFLKPAVLSNMINKNNVKVYKTSFLGCCCIFVGFPNQGKSLCGLLPIVFLSNSSRYRLTSTYLLRRVLASGLIRIIT